MLKPLVFAFIAAILLPSNAAERSSVQTRQELRQQRTCPQDAVVIMVMGQSNAANYAEGTADPADERLLNFYQGRCYIARDPLLGASRKKGSVWTVLGARIVGTRQVVLVPVAVGGTDIAQWVDGRPSLQLRRTMAHMQAARVRPDLVLWHQGESDSMLGTSEADYVSRFGAVLGALRGGGVDAPVIVAVASRCGRNFSDDVRRAQQSLPRTYANVLLGPDTDSLGKEYRPDGCHLLAAPHADLWEPHVRAALIGR